MGRNKNIIVGAPQLYMQNALNSRYLDRMHYAVTVLSE